MASLQDYLTQIKAQSGYSDADLLNPYASGLTIQDASGGGNPLGSNEPGANVNNLNPQIAYQQNGGINSFNYADPNDDKYNYTAVPGQDGKLDFHRGVKDTSGVLSWETLLTVAAILAAPVGGALLGGLGGIGAAGVGEGLGGVGGAFGAAGDFGLGALAEGGLAGAGEGLAGLGVGAEAAGLGEGLGGLGGALGQAGDYGLGALAESGAAGAGEGLGGIGGTFGQAGDYGLGSLGESGTGVGEGLGGSGGTFGQAGDYGLSSSYAGPGADAGAYGSAAGSTASTGLSNSTISGLGKLAQSLLSKPPTAGNSSGNSGFGAGIGNSLSNPGVFGAQVAPQVQQQAPQQAINFLDTPLPKFDFSGYQSLPTGVSQVPMQKQSRMAQYLMNQDK